MTQKLPAIRAGEQRTITFRFTPDLPDGTVIQSATVVARVYRGTDVNPSSLLNGSPLVAVAADSQEVFQSVIGAVNGNDYLLICQAITDGNEKPILTAILPVRETP
jgi:hypothetical protein